MDSRHVVMYFIVVLVIFGNNPTVVAEQCRYRIFALPYCVDALCKSYCWKEALGSGARVREYQCGGPGGINRHCICFFCTD
ncbi:hypothetical protein BRADI_1g76296v3 [Brachypodium distachyon]|uniref:Knottin scorpion toxin-like domain-containing protein n=1 Tax=Brachypodium distachyon TaxID=15368 RepID=A0A0Q3HLS8_BRADI|nr:hypothetical protein BRADI_1g76296v3 [Brachypodium distachyon]